jgi:hypothetical protein
VYWQWIKPIDACTVDDGFFVGHMLMDISAKTESELARAIKEFVARTEMLRDSFVHLGSLVIALLMPWTSDSQATAENVAGQTPQAVTEAQATCMGLILLSHLEGAGLRANNQSPRIIPSPNRKLGRSPRPNASPSARPNERSCVYTHDETLSRSFAALVAQFAALRKMNEYPWFEPMMHTICSRLTASKSATKSAARRLSMTSLSAAMQGSMSAMGSVSKQGSMSAMGSMSKAISKTFRRSSGAAQVAPMEIARSDRDLLTGKLASAPSEPTITSGGSFNGRAHATLSERRNTIPLCPLHMPRELDEDGIGASIMIEPALEGPGAGAGDSEFSSVVP